MITYSLPKRIRYIPASAIFSASFGNPSPGIFDFAGQLQIFASGLTQNTVYLIDSISIAGNLSEQDFLNAIINVPALTLKKSYDNTQIFDSPLLLNNFATDRQICHFFKTNQANCNIVATLSGKMNMTADLIGLSTMSLAINLSLHAIDDKDFEIDFKAQG